MGKRKIDDDLLRELEGIAAGQGCELVHVEFRGAVLRVVIDRADGGIGVEDCATVSRQISALLDVLDFDPGRYTLEVSSPGLDRPLYRPADYARFAGHLARVTFRSEESPKRTVVARIESFDPQDGGVVTLAEEGSGAVLEVPLADVIAARLEVEL